MVRIPNGIHSPQVGFEPTTNRLTVDRSTTELLRQDAMVSISISKRKMSRSINLRSRSRACYVYIPEPTVSIHISEPKVSSQSRPFARIEWPASGVKVLRQWRAHLATQSLKDSRKDFTRQCSTPELNLILKRLADLPQHA